MKRIRRTFLSLLSFILIYSCTSKLSEMEYFQQAYDLYNQGNFEEAIKNFNSVVDYYPDGENAAKSLFMIGFIHANHTQNYEQAKIVYTKFLEKYPDHELASSAKYEIDTLGKDINEIIKFQDAEEEAPQVKE